MLVYNETIRDLLAPENNDLRIHEDKHVRRFLIKEGHLCKSFERRNRDDTRPSL